MKKAILVGIVCMLAVPLTRVCAAEAAVDSKITDVMVYPDAVLVTRQAEAKVSAGVNSVIFSDIVPAVDENSLKVSLGKAAGVKLLGARVKSEFLQKVPAEQVQKLRDQVQQVEDQIRREQDIKRLLADEKNYLDSLRFFSQTQLPKDMITRVPSPAELEGTLKFLDTKLREHFNSVMESDLKTRELQNKLQALRQELSKIEGPAQKIKRSIVVELDAQKAGSALINLSYLVRGASWEPVYDARADFEKSQVELISYAILRQTTGEDWNNVNLSLSTARPSVGGNMPYVAPWFLRPFVARRFDESKTLGMRGKAAVQTMAFERDELMAPEAGMEEVNYAAAQEKGIAVVYAIPHKVSIKSDGAENKIPVSAQVLQSDFEYSAYPRAVAAAYLGSRVTNAKDLQLLGGRVNIFLEGDFVGASSIAGIGPGEEFDLYLGADENVKVKRELIEKKSSDTILGGIPSPKKTTTFKYKLTVENYKSRKIKVKLFEAMPVSEEKQIVATIRSVSLEPKIKDWQDRKGIWLWELELNPRQKQEISYSFSVEHPRDMQVEGL